MPKSNPDAVQNRKPAEAFNDAIEWPNGCGETPCTDSYRALLDEQNRLFDANHDSGSVDDLELQDYQRWHEIDQTLLEMQASGEHLGQPVRY